MDDLDLGATLKGFSPGQKIFNRYTLKKILGRGGMGVVWLARDEELERAVALKFLPEIVALDPEALADLKRETRRNLDLTHPHIVRIYDFVSDSRTAAISMEYVDGASISALKLEKPDRVFTIAELRPWLEQLCAALTYAHTKAKIVHRDLKPANLMVTSGGDLKITDFGIARGISDSVSRVSAQLGGSSGTPVYMSPQQMMGEKAAVTDDLYAIGATLYELLTGKPPFHSGNIIMQVQAKVPPPLAERRAELGITGETVPAAWERTIAACLAKEAVDRPDSTADLLARLKGEAIASALVAPPPPPPAVAPPPLSVADPATPLPGISGARRWLIASLVAAPLPALACYAFYFGWRSLGMSGGTALDYVLGGLILSLPMAVAALILLWLWRLCGGKEQPLLIGIGAVCGGVFSAGVILFLAQDRADGFTDEAVTWSLFATEIMLALLGGLVVGAAAGFWLRLAAFGAPAEWRLRAGLFTAASVLTAVLLFGMVLPKRFDATYVAEGDRQFRLWDEKEQIRREADETKAKAEVAALALKREQATTAQKALREREAGGLIREAYRMVFDRAPEQTVITRYTNLMITNPDWNAARLRQEFRKSAEGVKGGRLLVPEEFPAIAAALAAAVPGNAVHVAPGTYREKVYLDKAVDLIGAGRDRVTVEVAANQNALQVFKVNGVTVRGFTFRHTNAEDTERRSSLVSIDGSTMIFEENAVVDGNGNGLIIRGSGSSTVRRNIFRGQRWNGVTLYAGATGAVIDNVMENNQQNGLSVLEQVSRLEIARNTVTGSGYLGIWIGEGDNLTLTNNRVTGNGTAGQHYGGIGIGKGRPLFTGNVASDNIGAGIWWQEAARPDIQAGNMSDGKELTAP